MVPYLSTYYIKLCLGVLRKATDIIRWDSPSPDQGSKLDF
jgi:predicted Fe-S protein YdhL (DUF1289 family)